MKYIITVSLLLGGYSSLGITKDLVNPFTLVKPADIAQGKRINFIDQSKQTIFSQLSQNERKTFHIWKKEYFHTPKSFQEKFEMIGMIINFIVYNKLGNINNLLILFRQKLTTSNANNSLLTIRTEDMENILNFLSQLTEAEISTLNQWTIEYQEQGQKSVYRKVYLIMEEVLYGSRNLL